MRGPLQPRHYRISLEPDLQAFTFRGEVTITGELLEPAREVILDAAEITVAECRVLGERASTSAAGDERIVVRWGREVSGPLELTLRYDGILNDRMAGFYRSRYRSDGADKVIAVTQFEENDARRAFPCVDHPAFKATFDVELIVDQGLTAVSNQPVLSEEPTGTGKKRVRFERTPPMSTYLVFLGVGDFESATDTVDSRVRALTVPGRIGQARHSLELARQSLAFCEAYFRTPYPLPKLDLIAVPDFAYGAMENWGAITFRENLLQHEPGITSRAEEQRSHEVIAHEIAHQWFGDLVSPADWKYLWLNESFATLFGYRVVDAAHPDWGVWAQFLAGSAEAALSRDGMSDSPAIEIAGEQPVVINAANATILYSKGACILRQVEGYVGEDGFRAGLVRYLTEHAYSAAVSSDLWDSLGAASRKPVTAMMRSWIEQPGYPLVTASSAGREISLRQERFTYSPSTARRDAGPSTAAQRWLVPVSIALYDEEGSSRREDVLLEGETQSVSLPAQPWAFKLNAGQSGFFRVRYAEGENLRRLERFVASQALPPEDRWGLQDDLFALVRAGAARFDDYLSHLAAFAAEDAYLPLVGIAANLLHAFVVLGEPQRAAVAARGRALLQGVLERTGLEPAAGEPLTTSLLRSRVLMAAAFFGAPGVAEFAADRLRRLLSGASVPPDIRSAVMQVGAWALDAQALGPLLDLCRRSSSEQERLNVLQAMGCLRDRDALERVLRFALEEAPSRNKYIPIAAVAGNPAAAGWIWDWYRGNLAGLEKLHRMHHERVIASVVPLAGMERSAEARGFFAAYAREKPELADVISLSLERLEVNLRMRRAAAETGAGPAIEPRPPRAPV